MAGYGGSWLSRKLLCRQRQEVCHLDTPAHSSPPPGQGKAQSSEGSGHTELVATDQRDPTPSRPLDTGGKQKLGRGQWASRSQRTKVLTAENRGLRWTNCPGSQPFRSPAWWTARSADL